MKKKVFDKILENIKKKENYELEITYKEYKDYASLIKNKVKYNKNIYKENEALFDLCELATLTWGFLAISTLDSKYGSKDEHLITIFHALTTQISNNNLAILILINSGLEHQTGLAIDLESLECDIFKNSKEYLWIKENSYKYGFIIRYQEVKEKITGYGAEEWHIRYVGKKAAKYIYKKNITLEEYYNLFLK